MRASLEATKGYSAMKDSFDMIKLIKEIKGLTYQCGGQRYHAMSLHQAKKRWYVMYQGREMTNAHFLEKFNTNVLCPSWISTVETWALTRQPSMLS
jgi:hypothetical protein